MTGVWLMIARLCGSALAISFVCTVAGLVFSLTRGGERIAGLLMAIAIYGALQDAFFSCRSCAGARPGALPSLLWRSALVLIGEFLFQLLRHAGWASSVTIVSSAGFARPVYPLRYVECKSDGITHVGGNKSRRSG